MTEKLMLIDGNSILNRAFYGMQNNMLRTAEGLYTNALYGFLNILGKYTQEENPDYIAVAFDLKAPTFRHKEYDGYKATRRGMPQELVIQVPLIKEILDAMNIKRFELEGYEADDIVGTWAKKAERKGINCTIITGDRDALQLVSDKITVKLPVTKAGKTTTELYDMVAINEKYGVNAPQLLEVKALMGDSSDNIPGVPGVGEKTALELVKSYGTLDNIYENIDSISKTALKTKLEGNKELAYLSRKLAEICVEVPFEENFDDLKLKELNKSELKKIFNKLEFKSFINKYKLNEPDLPYLEQEFLPGFESPANFELEVLKIEELSSKLNLAKTLFLDYTLEGKKLIDLVIGFDSEVYKLSEPERITEIKNILEDQEVGKVFFNAKPFILWLRNKDIDLKGIRSDVSIAQYVADSTRSSENLGDIFRYFTGKDMEFNSSVQALMKLTEFIDIRLEHNGQKELYYDIELPLIKVLADMEYIGFKVDPNVLFEEGIELQNTINNLQKQIYELAGHNFNINSPKQLGEVLFVDMGLPNKKKTKTGYATGQEVLDELSEEYPIASLLIDYRTNTKLKSTYIDGLLAVIDTKTGRVHSSFNQTVTATGRLSSTEPNLQNIPIRHELGREIRKAFVPADGDHVLIDADYSQIELRILAHISRDEAMCEAFTKNLDIHAMTAAEVNGVDLADVTNEMRSRAKAVNFGIVYGISDFGLSRDLGIPKKEAKLYIDGYFKRYPRVKEYMDTTVAQAKENGYVTTLFGRRRYLPEINSSNYNIRSFNQRMAMNTPIQGSAADIIKIAMNNVYDALEKKGFKSRLILQVHDELLIDALKDEEEQVKSLLKEYMESAATLSVPLIADVSSGKNWFLAK